MPQAPPTHKPKRLFKTVVATDLNRPSASKRGYDRAWRRFRQSYLMAHPLCVDCGKRGHAAAACQVHHLVKLVDDVSRRLEESNVIGLCSSCHATRTARGE